MNAQEYARHTTQPGPVRAVVFDLDGLMVDSERLFFRVAERLLGRRGKTFTNWCDRKFPKARFF